MDSRLHYQTLMIFTAHTGKLAKIIERDRISEGIFSQINNKC